MYFQEINTDKIEEDTEIANDETKPAPLSKGIESLTEDMTSMLTKVANLYGNTIRFQDDLTKKNSIIKGAITPSDIHSVIKLINQDANIYINKMKVTANKLKKSYLHLENKTNILLSNGDRDKEYKSAYSKDFFHKTLNISMDKYLQENIDSGVFLIMIDDIKEKSNILIKNTYKSMLNKIYPELRYMDMVARISDNIFAILIVGVSKENFEFMLRQIIKKSKPDNLRQLVSAGLIGQFSTGSAAIKAMENNLAKAKHITDDYIMV